MKRNTLLKTGITGSIIAALCCFTPVLAWPLAAVGLIVLVAYIDYVFVPVMLIFLGITAYAFFIMKDKG